MPYLEAYGQIVVWGRGVYFDSRLLAHNHGEKMVGDKIYSGTNLIKLGRAVFYWQTPEIPPGSLFPSRSETGVGFLTPH